MGKARVVFEASLVTILGVAVFGSTLALVRKSDDYAFLDPLIEIKAALSSTYVDQLSPETIRKMQEGAISGMLEVLEDPYTVYVPPAQTAQFDKDLTGEYGGIGAQVQVIDGFLTIISPLEDSPALRAGLLPDDRVVEIEGQSTLGLTVEQCVERLTGKPGTEVKLTLERKGQKMPMTLVREKIKTRVVKGFHRDDKDSTKWQFMIDDKRSIAYIRLTQFTPRCTLELIESLRACGALDGRLKGLVLDVRGNPGGLLEEAVAMADLFLKDGVIVSTRGRAFSERVAKAQAPGTLGDFPIAVLINGSSASASEILAGALVENGRAIAVGTRTFGKGSVQSVRPITVREGDGSEKRAELKITEQGYYLPSGKSITRKPGSTDWGVDPSKGFYVPLTDEQTLEMLRVRRDEEILRATDKPAEPGQKWDDTDWTLDSLKDPQLTAAVRAMQQRLDTGEWKPTGQESISLGDLAGEELARIHAARDRLTRELIRLERRADEIEKGTSVADAGKRPDLWADSLDLTGGRVQVFDKDGNLVSTLSITGNSLERWLMDADVKKAEPDPNPK